MSINIIYIRSFASKIPPHATIIGSGPKTDLASETILKVFLVNIFPYSYYLPIFDMTCLLSKLYIIKYIWSLSDITNNKLFSFITFISLMLSVLLKLRE